MPGCNSELAISLEQYKRQRGNIKRNISRIKSIVDGTQESDDKPSQAELKCRLGILEAYFKQALSVQADIEDLDPSDNGRADLEDNYVTIKLCIQSQLGEEVNNTVSYSETPTSALTVTSSHLPRLSLPIFDGSYAEYKNFITSFTQLIAREPGLTNIERFNYLLSCLKGSALETVKAFQVTSENYPKALDRLSQRFDNPTLIFLENIAALFTLQPVEKSNHQQLRSLVDKASAIFSSLESLGTGSNIAQGMMIHLIIDKCDQETRNKWNGALDFRTLPTWLQCSQVLERHCQFLQSSNSTSHPNHEHVKHNRGKSGPTLSFAITNASSSCVICSSNDHKLVGCSHFRAMSTNSRFDIVKKFDRCINCLGSGHQMAQCPSKHRCRTCNRAHHTLLHHHRAHNVDQLSQSAANGTPQEPAFSAASHSHIEHSKGSQVILATAMILVKDASGSYKLGRALLDSCSQVNFMTDQFSQSLRLHRDKQNVEIRSIGGSVTNIKARATTTIKSRITSCEIPLEFCITSHIAYHPDVEIDTKNWNLPANTPLADEWFFQSRHIDILIGTEAFFDLLSVGQIKLGPDMPTLQKTLLGWIVSGKYQHKQQTQASSLCLLTCEESIDNSLQQLWKIEDVNALATPLQPEHRICETLYANTTYQQNDGRIVVSLPFKDDPSCLGDSFGSARRRFLALERRLSRSPEIRSNYISFMQEYEQLGHMTPITTPEMTTAHYYIPHHCILKPNSVSTKLRVVFDASCRTSSQRSLNDLLLVGPTLQDDLYTLLLRFRLFQYALTADVTKMYRQVLINKNDRKFQYILWRASPDANLQTYELNTVTYGTAAAPYLAVRSLQFLADKYMAELPIGASTIKSCFYVDDLLCGADDINTLHTIRHQVTEVLRRGMFPLAKWHSNHPDLMEDDSGKELNRDKDATTSALGLIWNQHQDTLLFTFNPKQTDATITKRTILSIASSLYDPLGLLSPLIIVAKIILQELWLAKVHWDESVPQAIHQAWTNCLLSLSSLSSFVVPRYGLQPNAKIVQLHGFCDSSIRAYGCCIYIRTEDSAGHITVQLLTSKSRVAPLKKKSLPRLELCGAHLLARLYSKVKETFVHRHIKTYCWTDSKLVLYWLQQHSATLSTFVGNRVSDIQDHTADVNWNYVPTQLNPADLVSRGCTVDELSESTWFSGPAFLTEDDSKWPVNGTKHNLDEDIVNAEKRKSIFAAFKETNYLLNTINNISSYTHCLRVIAWMFRFIQKCKWKTLFETQSPSPQELRHALYCIVWNIQQHHFPEELRLLRKQLPLKTNLKSLTPFLDVSTGFELIKVGGRLEYADLPDAQRHPVLLPRNSEFVYNYVRHLHLRNYHAGPKALVALIRLEYWVVNARVLCRRIVRSCIHCVRYRPKLMQQLMGPLPHARVSPARPFERSGVDFCGPINTYLRIRGKGPTKSYLAIFVCLTTKAVHIEVVADLSTNAFLNALKRMGGRRRMPCDIYCDNATNFVGACNKLKDLRKFLFNNDTQKDIYKFCSNEFINFHFIPPRAPHFGGLWEAAVKSAKGLLNRTLVNTRFTFEELSTVAVEIEAILNSRPLSPLSSDPNDYEALTAGHLLVGDSLRALPERALEPRNITNLDRYDMITAVKQRFWHRWSTDYINELRARTKWTSSTPNVVEGTLVVIHDDNLPPQRWRLGRVESTVLGKDGRVRVVHLRTATGNCCRPIHKLAILPIT